MPGAEGDEAHKAGEGDEGVQGTEEAEGAEGAEEVDQREVSTIILESSGYQKYSTLLVIQLFSRRLCLCHCLCIRLCFCVPYSFLNRQYDKLSENVRVWGVWGKKK